MAWLKKMVVEASFEVWVTLAFTIIVAVFHQKFAAIGLSFR
jgi:hypothetical protein